MISTGYFAKTKSYLEAGLTPVSIAYSTPEFFKFTKWSLFAPPKKLLYNYKKGQVNEEEYRNYYIKYLNKVVTPKSLDKIKKLFYNKDIVMCCYEKPNSFCHRHILADWLNEKLNLIITEVYIVKG